MSSRKPNGATSSRSMPVIGGGVSKYTLVSTENGEPAPLFSVSCPSRSDKLRGCCGKCGPLGGGCMRTTCIHL